MIINILNNQKIIKPNIIKLKALAGFFLDQIEAGKKNIAEVTILLTDDAGIRPINLQFFDRDGATDVISFFLHPGPAKNDPGAAEIVINIERALKEGRKRRGVEHEFALYLAHGCDHLAGFDDRTATERNKMRRRESGWLKRAAAAGILSGLFNLN